MSRRQSRTFSRAFKLEAIARMDAGENASALSRDLGEVGGFGGHEGLVERRGAGDVAGHAIGAGSHCDR